MPPAPLGRVTYTELWPGISVTYDTAHGGIVRSTWEVAPGADPALIRLRYNRPVSLNADGTLAVTYETGAMTESAPVAWQDGDGKRHAVEASFTKLGQAEVGYRVGSYRHDLSLKIDPTLSWNTFLGGSDNAYGIAVDASGSVYVVGYSDTSWGTPVNAHSGGGVSDAFVAKLNSSGALIWNTFLGGTSPDVGTDIAADAGGSVYLAGYSDTSWGTPVNAHSGGGVSDAFVAKLNSSGALIWNTFLGGAFGDSGWAIALDASGNAYVAGTSYGAWGTPVNAHNGGGVSDAFAAKLNSSGALTWNTFLGSSSDDEGYGIAADASGNAYVAGHSGDTWGTPVDAHNGGPFWDAFVAKLSSSGALTWNTFLGGTANDSGNAIAVDASGNAYVAGISYGTWGTPVRAYTGSTDAFAAKLSSSGALV
jgi:hypothetical protein